MNQNTIESHQEEFSSLVDIPAFTIIRDQMLADLNLQSIHLDMESLAKHYIREAAIRDVFRTFDRYAAGGDVGSSPEEDAQLLPESDLDDGALELLDQ